MKYYLLILILFTAFFQVSAQKLYQEKLTGCATKFKMEDKELYIYYEPNDSIMVRDFLSGLDEKQLNRLQGAVMLQIMIDTTNTVCCLSYTNKTTISDKKFDIPNRIKQMQGWKRAKDKLPDENISALISFVFSKTEFTVIRTVYNRNYGRKIVETTIYQRKKKKKSADKK